MNRQVFFGLLIAVAVGAAVGFSFDLFKRDRRAFLRRFGILLLFFVLMSGLGQLSLMLCRWLFPSPLWRPIPFGTLNPTIPLGLPAVSLTTLLCGIVVLFLYRRAENLSLRLKESERIRTRLLKDLAHDVRSPVTALGLVLDGMRHADRASTALRELDYLQRLIDGLLLLAQLEDPDFGKDAKPIPVLPVLGEVVDQIEDHPDKAHLDFKVTASDVAIFGERTLLDRALRNALENAGRHAATRIEIAAEARNGFVEIVVRDDGPGFTPEALVLFGKRRTSGIVDTQQAAGQSMGLGSNILVSCVERMGGTVTAANGSGAVVTMRIPRAS